jgi:hypothetical protein
VLFPGPLFSFVLWDVPGPRTPQTGRFAKFSDTLTYKKSATSDHTIENASQRFLTNPHIDLKCSDWLKCEIPTNPDLQEKSPAVKGGGWLRGNVIQEANGNLFTHFYFTILFGSSSIRPTPSIARKCHQGSNPGGHSFSFLNTSINKKQIFFSAVVILKTLLLACLL